MSGRYTTGRFAGGAASALLAAATILIGSAPGALADPAVQGTYNPTPLTRVLDTRSGLGAPAAGAIPSGKTVTFQATSGLSTPGISAVALTITAVDPSRSGHLTVYPAETSRTNVSTVNFQAHRDTANATVMRVPPSVGTVVVYNGSAGTVHVLADRSGYWTGEIASIPGAYDPISPYRLLDTRSSGGAPMAGGTSRTLQVTGHGVPAGAGAVAINVTAVAPTRGGSLTVDADPQTAGPPTTTVSFQAGETRADFTVAKLSPTGAVTIHAGTSGTVHVLIDVLGYFRGGTPVENGAYAPTVATRVADTRTSSQPLAPGADRKIAIYSDSASAANTQAVVVTVTAVAPQQGGHLTVWDGTTPVPTVSAANFDAGETVSATVIVPINPDGTISVHNGSSGSTDLVVDLLGHTVQNVKP